MGSPDAARSAHLPAGIVIRRWAELADAARLLPEVDAIFFEASNTKDFADEAERAAFRERWLGRYLKEAPQWAYVALAADGAVAGYLVGGVQGADDVAQFANAARLASDYPAHLHVNLALPYRNHGIGGRLIDAFAADAARAGAKGVRVVTAAGARNVGFYQRNGFRMLAHAALQERELVVLGRRLSATETA